MTTTRQPHHNTTTALTAVSVAETRTCFECACVLDGTAFTYGKSGLLYCRSCRVAAPHLPWRAVVLGEVERREVVVCVAEREVSICAEKMAKRANEICGYVPAKNDGKGEGR